MRTNYKSIKKHSGECDMQHIMCTRLYIYEELKEMLIEAYSYMHDGIMAYINIAEFLYEQNCWNNLDSGWFKTKKK